MVQNAKQENKSRAESFSPSIHFGMMDPSSWKISKWCLESAKIDGDLHVFTEILYTLLMTFTSPPFLASTGVVPGSALAFTCRASINFTDFTGTHGFSNQKSEWNRHKSDESREMIIREKKINWSVLWNLKIPPLSCFLDVDHVDPCLLVSSPSEFLFCSFALPARP